jgi:hypothetical protein
MVVCASGSTLCHPFEESVCAHLFDAKAAEEVLHFASSNAAVIVPINYAEGFANMGKPLRCLFSELFQHVVELVGYPCNLRI